MKKNLTALFLILIIAIKVTVENPYVFVQAQENFISEGEQEEMQNQEEPETQEFPSQETEVEDAAVEVIQDEECPDVWEENEQSEDLDNQVENVEVWEEESPEEPETEELSGQEAEVFFDEGEEEMSALAEEVQVEKNFLEKIDVFSNSTASESAKQELIRCEELDEEFGGIVYTTDYSSISSSSNFYVAAKLSEEAPEDSAIFLSGYTEEKTITSTQIPVDSYDKGMCYRLSGSVFESGQNGGKRAVYTLTAGNSENYQIYKIIVRRQLHLAMIGCYDMADNDMSVSLLDKKFNRAEHDYFVKLSPSQSGVKLRIRPYSDCWYQLKVNGESFESTDFLDIPVMEDAMEITLSLSQEGGYNDPEYEGKTYLTENTYCIYVTRSAGKDVTFVVSPETAIVSLYHTQGERILPVDKDEKGYCFENLMEGMEYTYNVSSYGYISVQGSFVAGETAEIPIELKASDTRLEEFTDNEWQSFRNNEENNGVTSVSIPSRREDAVLQWAVQLGGEWSSSATPPLILDGYLYTAAGKFIYKLDRATGQVVSVSDELAGSMVFAMNPLAYASGMIFAQIGNGQIQAYNAKTLKSIWISEPLGGQTLSPITYKNGYIYTGTWNSEIAAGSYFCLSVTDEDPDNELETKYCTWKYQHKGGFYWAGAYASEKYIVFGSDDGSEEGDYSDTSILYSVSSKTGLLIDMVTQLKGDIRTTVVYENGYIYFATKGGYLYRIKMNADGSFGEVASYNLGGMATASPVVYKGRIYIGVCGKGGQFNPDSGHHFDVLQEKDQEISLAYSVPVSGYPQAAALLSTAREQEDMDGDGRPDGTVCVYFTINAYPGGIYVLEDAPGRQQGTAELYFEPDAAQQQYGISTVCVDRDGTLYFKNDSCYLIAVSSNKAGLMELDAQADSGQIKWDRSFHTSRLKYQLTVEGTAKNVIINMKAAEDCTIQVNGKKCDGTYVAELDENQNADVIIEVQKDGKCRKYALEITGAGNDASLKQLIVSTNNSYTVDAEYIPVNPAFAPDKMSYYTDIYDGNHTFLNIFLKKPGKNAVIKMSPVSGAEKITGYENASSSDAEICRFAVYFKEQYSEASVDIHVTSGDGLHEKTYRVCLRRTDIYPPVLSDISVERKNEREGEVVFTSNEAGACFYKIVTANTEEPDFIEETAGINIIQGQNTIALSELSQEAADLYILAVDGNGNKMKKPAKVSLAKYQIVKVSVKARPENAKITVVNSRGEKQVLQDGFYTLLEGNRYTVIVSCEGYVTQKKTIVASAEKTEYLFTLDNSRSNNAWIKSLYVSSSGIYGRGVQKLTPGFHKETTSYSASYGGERESLFVWVDSEDEKAEIKMYALGGIQSSTVQEDESITGNKDEKGHKYWQIFFAENQFEANVRICVIAEDGTVKNTFVSLNMQDITAPVLQKVSASRVSAANASVVFKTSEKGYCYYSVTDADTAEPEIDMQGDGIQVSQGTNILSLEDLTKGEKDVFVRVKDEAENLSAILKIRIPDSRNGYNGQAQQGTGGSGNSSSPLGGTMAPALSQNHSQTGRDGFVGNLREASEQTVRHEKSKDNKKQTQKEENAKETNSIKTEKAKDNVEKEGDVSEISKRMNKTAETMIGLSSFWKKMSLTQKGMFFCAGFGCLFLLFWWRAKRYGTENFF